MIESNILDNNEAIKQLQKEVLPNTRGQYMKDSNILADNQLSSNYKRKSWQIPEGST